MKRDFKNILVIRTDRLGDVILTTPAIKCLREAYPKARITLLVSPGLRPIVDGNPYVDEILVDDRFGLHRWLSGFINLVGMLRARKFDLAIIYHTKKRTNLTCFAAGIPVRIGFRNNKFGFLLTEPLVDRRHLGEKHESEYCLDVLKHLDIPAVQMEFFVAVNAQAEQWLDNLLKENAITAADRLIVVHPGASDPTRRWPMSYFSQLVGLIQDKYPSKFILMGDKEIEYGAQNITSRTQTVIINLAGKTNLSQLVSLIKRCDLLISNDSGPVHLATGLNRPVVAIFTRNQKGINPTRWGPLGAKAKVVAVAESEGISFTKSREISSDYLELIKPQEVFEAVDALLKTCYPASPNKRPGQ